MSFLTMRALLFAAECAAASLLLPLLAFAATRMVRRAALRHLIWLTMFGVLAVLPLAALVATSFAMPSSRHLRLSPEKQPHKIAATLIPGLWGGKRRFAAGSKKTN